MFLAKILEKIATTQIRAYLNKFSLFPKMQSAYRHYHSTETTLVKVFSDVLLALDKGQEAVLVLLDFSAAFECIDHSTMTNRFQTYYGISGTVLKWLVSYLENRKQQISINGTLSAEFPLPWGVPQGSVLGPLLYILYTGPLCDIISSHSDIRYAIYADDTQLYITMSPNDHSISLQKLSDCVKDIMTWSTSNNLKLNQSKTEVVHITSKFRRSNDLPSLDISEVKVHTSDNVRDLGVIIDSKFDMKQHIKNTCRAASFGISKIGKIRKYLDMPSTERLIHAFVTSHLDYCNSLYFGLPSSTLSPLQHIQNTAARLVTRSRKCEHVTPILQSLHWLPVTERIKFKILLLVFKIRHDWAPTYLSNLLHSVNPSRNLRSNKQAHLQYAPGPRTYTRYGDRAFSAAAPKLWNSLPFHIRNATSIDSFKSKLKQFLFNPHN